MRTLALLAALLLLALHAQAEPVPETTEEALDQEQPGDEDQGMAISFEGADRSALQDAGRAIRICHCRSGRCPFPARKSGTCRQGPRVYTLCCQ